MSVPFGGRNRDLALLDAWLDDAGAPPRYLLTAPAGRGKSALLVRWLQHLQRQGRVGRDAHSSWRLVFVPISVRVDLHRADTFYEAIAARMAELLLNQELPPTQTDKATYYADHCRTLASAAIANGRRILIVLDGIDEAVGERFDARWFPRNPGAALRLLLSARWQAGDTDSTGWKSRLRWDHDVLVRVRELPIIDRYGVRDLLIKMGAPTDVIASRPEIIDRLYVLSEGEPLVLRYYAEDIWAKGDAAPRLTVDDLVGMRPGFGGFFEQWLDDQERLWREASIATDRPSIDAILAIFACAHGRLRASDVKALLSESRGATLGGRFLDSLEPIRRFVIGRDQTDPATAGYILSHPKLGIYLREEHFDHDYIQEKQAAFVSWGHKTIERLNSGALRPQDAPAYLLQYHTAHLKELAAPADAFLRLVDFGWLRAWEIFEGGYRGFSRDTRQAYEALSATHAIDQPRLAQRLRCQLVLSSIHSMGTNTPWELLVAAFEAGVLTYRQVAHWLEFKPLDDRVSALTALASHLPAELVAEVLTVITAIDDSDLRASALAALAPHLSVELLREALAAARAIKDNYARANALTDLAPHLPAELLPQALAAARAIKDNYARAEALATLVPYLPADVRGEVLSEVLSEEWAIPRLIKGYSARAEALADLTPHLSVELLREALAAVRTVKGDHSQVDTLSALAPHLPSELLPQALVVARTIKGHSARAEALATLAPYLGV